MPDGSRFGMAPPLAPDLAPPGHAPRWGRAACLALVLHATVALPIVLALEHDPTPATVEGVELAPPLEEAAAPAEQPESVAEAVEAAAPEAAQPAETAPPETLQAEAPPDQQAPPPDAPDPTPPLEMAELLPPAPPEPLRAEPPPPEAAPSQEPELQVAEAAPEEATAAALPPPPPPMPAPPRPVSRPRPVARPAPPGPPSEAPPAPMAAPAPAASPAQAAPAAAPRRPSAGYLGSLLAALERHKDYPLAARHRRAQGTAMLRFAMRRDGAVTHWRIERSTGDPELDAAVGQMVRRASPLPAPPADLPGDPIELVVPVNFFLR